MKPSKSVRYSYTKENSAQARHHYLVCGMYTKVSNTAEKKIRNPQIEKSPQRIDR